MSAFQSRFFGSAMKYLLAAFVLAGCSPTYPIYTIPVESYAGPNDLGWTPEDVIRVDWDKSTTFEPWGFAQNTSECLEYWAQWSWRKSEPGGEEGVVTGLRVKRVVTQYDHPITELTKEEWLGCVELGDK